MNDRAETARRSALDAWFLDDPKSYTHTEKKKSMSSAVKRTTLQHSFSGTFGSLVKKYQTNFSKL